MKKAELYEANLLHGLTDRRMEHVGHPCPYIGLGLETIVRVMRIQEVIGRLFRAGGWLILLADPDALRGLHPLRAFHIYDLTHRCILPGEVSFVRNPRVLIGGLRKEETRAV
jgi:hypothetical protein